MEPLSHAWADLVLGRRCVGCDTPGPWWCARCAPSLTGPPRRAAVIPVPAGLPDVWTVSEYADPVRSAVNAHKERGALALAVPLGDALGRAVLGLLAHHDRSVAGPVWLVPPPSSARSVRRRGHDPAARIVGHAASCLRGAGIDARRARALRLVAPVADQSGLSSSARRANVQGAYVVRRRLVPALAGSTVVVVDDVVTTGATLSEATRAVRAVGAHVLGAAVVAATRRTSVAVHHLFHRTSTD